MTSNCGTFTDDRMMCMRGMDMCMVMPEIDTSVVEPIR